jgi:protein involved in polysaccharide export with SLBB domain
MITKASSNFLFKSLLLLITFTLCIFSTQAQGILSQKDLTNFKADALTESDISQIQLQLKSKGVTIDQVQDQAVAKGMSLSEFTKLKARLNNPQKTGGNKNPLLKLDDQLNKDKRNKKSGDDTTGFELSNIKKINPLIYGSELFNNDNTGFAANQNIATPINYILGPNDVLKLVVYGVQEYTSDLQVSKEGRVQIENVGQVKVGGLSIEAATERIKQQMARTVYSSLLSGDSKLALAVGDIRTIQVSVIGAMKSGKYNVSSLSNVLSVLTEAGGPNEIGSFRNIELIRNNKVESKIDLYQFMQYGDQKQMMSLKDNDVIRIPAYGSRIEIKGQAKRPGIFEPIANETFKNVLDYAGGFDDTAYTALVKVIQKTDKERAVKDLIATEFNKYIPSGGDVIMISKIIDRYRNRVKLSGAIYRPDTYELFEGMRISDLIKRGDGLKEDAFTGGAQLFRLKPNLIKEIVNIDLGKALSGDKSENIYLQREDELYVTSILDLRDSLDVRIYGEVHNPGKYQYADSMTVKDLVTLAGGSTFAANKKVEVARLYKQQSDLVNNTEIATLLTTELDANLNFTPGNSDIVLQPYDVVSITKRVGFTENQIVSITGQVQFEGKYSLISRVERVSDVIKRAGGLIGDAYAQGAFIKRQSIKADTVSQVIKDSLKKMGIAYEPPANVQSIALDIDQILKNPGSYYDLVLADKDEIVIPKLDNKITIRGGVLRPITITYHEGITLGECISAAGGITENARRNKAYVVYFNGHAKRTKTFGFFRFNPRIEPGSEVVLPEGAARKDVMTSILQYVTILAQIGTSLATLQLLSK